MSSLEKRAMVIAAGHAGVRALIDQRQRKMWGHRLQQVSSEVAVHSAGGTGLQICAQSLQRGIDFPVRGVRLLHHG